MQAANEQREARPKRIFGSTDHSFHRSSTYLYRISNRDALCSSIIHRGIHADGSNAPPLVLHLPVHGSVAASPLDLPLPWVRVPGGDHRRYPAGLQGGEPHLPPAGGVLPDADPRPEPAPPRRHRGESGRAAAGRAGRPGALERAPSLRGAARHPRPPQGQHSHAGPAQHHRRLIRAAGLEGARRRRGGAAAATGRSGNPGEGQHGGVGQLPLPGRAELVERSRRAGPGKLLDSLTYPPRASLAWCSVTYPPVGMQNPYVLSADPCGSSSGSAIAAAANMAAVTLGTETDGSIICPSDFNSVAGIKPTVGLTSRAGVVPISPRQDTVLEAIVGFDQRDAVATKAASKYIPRGGYKQFLKLDGLRGKRIGILRAFFSFSNGSFQQKVFEVHLNTMRQKGAILIDNLEIANLSIILDPTQSGEEVALLAEFKMALNSYLSELSSSPWIISLTQERVEEFGQLVFLAAQNTAGIGPAEKSAIARMTQLSIQGLERLMMENKLDAVVAGDIGVTAVLAIGGYPGISVPAGYGNAGVPFGICFGGVKGSEPKLIEMAYAFEQATLYLMAPKMNFFGVPGSSDGVAFVQPRHKATRRQLYYRSVSALGLLVVLAKAKSASAMRPTRKRCDIAE
ncbi:hypothetical protein BHM03_00017940 [Ensete ventricosum]|nr:hypothetical protein BHM03_00017940 [Ensete ventricosum]